MKLLTGILIAGLATTACASSRIEQITEQSIPKVVKIGVIMEKGGGSCSGSFISKRGIVLTSAHCFTHGVVKKIFIKTYDGKVYNGAVMYLDAIADLALVVPDNIGPFEYFKLGVEPIRGQQVLSFGSPLGIQNCVSVGWVSNLIHQGTLYVFHSAFISPGSSGGPLVDLDGKLVGVNRAMINYGFLQTAQGLYVAVDIIKVKEMLRQWAAL